MRPPGVSKLSVVALREKKSKQLLSTRLTFDLVMTGQRSIFGEVDIFSTLQDNSDGGMANIAMKPLLSCSVDNWHHFAT